MADGNGAAFNATGGNNSALGSSIGGDDGIIRIDPGAIDASATAAGYAETTKPGYGPNGRKLRKDGQERRAKGESGNASTPRAAQATFPVEALAGTIVGIHALLSASLKIPELSLDPKEGAHLAAALANLQRYYPVHVTEKALAWGNVFSALGLVYGTRFAAMRVRIASERKNSNSASNIVRPAAFQQPRPTVHAPQPQPAQSEVMTPDGDPVAPMPTGATAQPRDIGDRIFSATPPELM
jgi:hypothetical protein